MLEITSVKTIEEKAMVEILRGSRPEFGMEVSSQDLEERKSLWPF